MPEPTSFNYLAILTAAVSTFLLGGLWFSPLLFLKPWMQELGLNYEDRHKSAGNIGRIMGISFVLELIMAFNLAAFIGPRASFSFGVFAGAAAGFGWVALAFGVTYLFERKSFRFFLINGGYHGVAFTIMGGILGAWK